MVSEVGGLYLLVTAMVLVTDDDFRRPMATLRPWREYTAMLVSSSDHGNLSPEKG